MLLPCFSYNSPFIFPSYYKSLVCIAQVSEGCTQNAKITNTRSLFLSLLSPSMFTFMLKIISSQILLQTHIRTVNITHQQNEFTISHSVKVTPLTHSGYFYTKREVLKLLTSDQNFLSNEKEF